MSAVTPLASSLIIASYPFLFLSFFLVLFSFALWWFIGQLISQLVRAMGIAAPAQT
ncbi:hypothetical protein BDV41DRAFT_545614 [Aspergillus transmontanensis]|uniref:Uncharacterized protein n=1 Tax=Aspergillus transmontanensis TaxID=1034304 RepID=A0A5N6VQ61_9EURO|nr:hypothetical protein BDV41DRAFT_545614 [Aspergillus transmontanensis]